MNNFISSAPKLIGITGGIGSGKSTFARYIAQKGFPVYNSDIRAKEIVNENKLLQSKIIALLGEDSYVNGEYNRVFVAKKVFQDKTLLHQLNTLIHPAVKEDFELWLSHQNTSFAFKETALLFELNLNENCYKSILVTAEDNLRKKRVMDRDNKTYREVEAIMEQQMPEKDKIKKADFVIFNNDGINDLEIQANKILNELTAINNEM